MKVQAVAKFVRVSPRKMNIMAGLVRRKSLEAAREQLSIRPERAARLLLSVLDSAAANAYENHSLDRSALIVNAIEIGQGPRLKRFTPRAFGRATPIRKPTSHIRVVIEGEKTVVRTKKVKPTTVASQSKASETEEGQRSNTKESLGQKQAPEKKGFLRKVFQRKSGM
ncbi:50S ribosomal protein L22 [Candidatus Uhrbacteria bacterium]|nr:50S ribosomal protein L22 [Candidatus Uhrbacteria bacterium]